MKTVIISLCLLLSNFASASSTEFSVSSAVASGTAANKADQRKGEATLALGSMTVIPLALLMGGVATGGFQGTAMVVAGAASAATTVYWVVDALVAHPRFGVLDNVKDEAIAYVANGYEDPSQLLVDAIRSVRESAESQHGIEIANLISDESIAAALATL